MAKRCVYGWMIGVTCFIVLMKLTPKIPQPQTYHDFADKRTFLGIPHAPDVISNFPFLFIGLTGLIGLFHPNNYFKISLQGEKWAWACFYMGVTATIFGSSYYHLKPNDPRLVWDRLPMVIALMPIVSIFIIERIDEKKGTLSIIPLMLCGIFSIVYWRLSGDICLYGLTQFVPFIAIALIALFKPPMYTHSMYWLWATGLFGISKVTEATDRVIFKLTFHSVSGHTLKHLFAAMASVLLTVMLAKRTVDVKTRQKAM